MSSLLELPFDQYQRYRLVADLLTQLPGSQNFSILDVGGRTALLREFLPNHQVHLVDVEGSDVGGLILGSGAALPFADNSFDAVCAFDTLEHVPVDLRDAFVEECARVASGYVFIAGPYQQKDVQHSEELLQAFLSSKIGAPHRYLDEHRELGLPDRKHVQTLFESAGAQVSCIGHGRLDRWLLAMCLELYLESDPLLQPLGKRFYAFYNQMVYPHDHGGDVYRHVVVAAFGDRDLPTAEKALAAPALPRASEELLATFANQVLEVDGARTIWQPEQKRLQGIIADLEKDLSEHQESLKVARVDLEQHKQTLTASEADLIAHKNTLATSEQDLAEHKRSLAETFGDLQAHKESLAELETLRAREVEAQNQVQKTLRSEIEQTTQYARSLEAEIQQASSNEEHAKLVEHRDQLASELDAINKVATELNTALVQANEAIAGKDHALSEVAREKKVYETRLAAWKIELDRLNATIEQLNSEAAAQREEAAAQRSEVQRFKNLIVDRKAILKLLFNPNRGS